LPLFFFRLNSFKRFFGFVTDTKYEPTQFGHTGKVVLMPPTPITPDVALLTQLTPAIHTVLELVT
jgi:hypothetical protein